MNRRKFLTLTSLASAAVAAGAADLIWQNATQTATAPTQQELIERAIKGLITKLPAGSETFAWTIDDGSDAEVLGKYLDRAVQHDLRFTFFVNSSKQSWRSQAAKLHPLVDSGQVQLANHAHNHFDLTTLTDAEVHYQISTCHEFLLNTFGVDARPFWRPPFRMIDQRVAKIAAEIGYTRPTMWSNNLINASPSTTPKHTLERFETEVHAGAILLDHMHGLESDTDFGVALASLKAKKLGTTTLDAAFG